MKFSVPFEYLVSKNEKHTQRRRHTQKWVDGLNDTYTHIAQYDFIQNHNPWDEPVIVVMRFWEPTAHRRDIHNYEELLLDAMEGHESRFPRKLVVEDDYYIYAAYRQRMGVDRENPRVEVEVYPLSEVDVTIDILQRGDDDGR